jgi:hypothetical protein
MNFFVFLVGTLFVSISAVNFPGTVFFSQDGCKGSFGAFQHIPNQCVQKPSGEYFKYVCDSKNTVTQTCRDPQCRVCQNMTQSVGCQKTASIVCSPLPRITSKGVVGTVYNQFGCKGIPTNYFLSYDDQCVGDWKLYCDLEKGTVVYEKYRWNGCQGEVTKREFKQDTCQMGIVLSIQMNFKCNNSTK